MVPTTTNLSSPANALMPMDEAGLATGRGVDQVGGITASQKPAAEPLPPAIDDFDAVINGDVKTFVNMSEEIGGLVAEQV